MQASDVPVAKLRNHVLDEAQGVQSIVTRRTQLHVVDHRAVVHRHVALRKVVDGVFTFNVYFSDVGTTSETTVDPTSAM